MESCEILQGSWKQIAIRFLASWTKCGGKLEEVCANMPKKLRASQAQFRAMCGKSLCKSTENEEAGKAQSCADVQRNTRNVCANVQKIDGKTHESALKTHENVLYLINNAREVRYFCVKMVKITRKMNKICVECI